MTKTPRDKLYDIASQVAETSALSYDESSKKQFLNLDTKIAAWQQDVTADRSCELRYECQEDFSPRSCICSLSISKDDVSGILLSTEARSLQLVIDLEIWKRHTRLGYASAQRSRTSEQSQLRNRIRTNVESIEASLRLPCFRQTDEKPEIMTEGLCRSVLPNLALKRYRESVDSDDIAI